MAVTLQDHELQEILIFTSSLAREAGAIILEGSRAILGTSGKIDEKKNSVDLVTEWDVKVEEFVRAEIKKKYPAFGFIGEESYSSGQRPPLTDDPTYCVDPIDGTTNFVHGFPFVCISLGLIYKKRPTIGVIYNPFLDQLYTGLTGHGSHLTQRNQTHRLPLHAPGPLKSLHDALIAVEWGSDRSRDVMDLKSQSFVRLAGNPEDIRGGQMAHSLRSVGSAALNFALVASGSLDLYWEIGCWPWDVCAGVVIAQEAGGFVSGASSAPHDGDVDENILTGRKYIVVRALPSSVDESSTDGQRRIVKAFYASVSEWDAI
ncbi:inositol monophosphatase [Sistotremastrum niveocremeum HHB9708]|uniref:Inositol-1-monophosphatase n=2 Tax=Sistotremastraceae TaxID=3402574 RepID=A0A164UA18_9AGAM|nr:inositol monophosphatase [Sistotremastrum niveocremeum HHB9708]KZT44283.1 hypothetical protein SISSUDRAFT_1038778 [Sistotremastrum suecicum HHB10207 ss-3]